MITDIAGHPDYVVSTEGEVFRKTPSGLRALKPEYSTGHARVRLNGENLYVGKVVLESFEPTDNPKHRVFHLNGDVDDNRLSNLMWATPSEIQLYSTYTIEYRVNFLKV